MTVVIMVALTLVLIGAALVVFTRSTARQAVLLAVYGLLLVFVFLAMQAPDVALSQLAVGTAVVPLMVMLTIRKISALHRDRKDRR
ncbi:DUF4040 domain-containing protein [Microlunatus elymi]|uniref:DUF4040 domain-containing protein n=1 Tax=Microlunatus elymi TaxID=2596828 RepID=A0A516Q232_9ACTN|nr:hydrogenase subunit MbhD domain-containing protein [Microlunatus elymi]QDP97484.1 DUF4040 domain-containing protein [Microlunatus elymi]